MYFLARTFLACAWTLSISVMNAGIHAMVYDTLTPDRGRLYETRQQEILSWDLKVGGLKRWTE